MRSPSVGFVVDVPIGLDSVSERVMNRFSTLYCVALSGVDDEDDVEQMPIDEILGAMRLRLRELTRMSPGEARESSDAWDTYQHEEEE